MEKYIPYEKLSKKEKRKLDAARRSTWGELNPVTRKPQNSKAYSRKKMQNCRKELPNSASFYSPTALDCRLFFVRSDTKQVAIWTQPPTFYCSISPVQSRMPPNSTILV